jgi:hypothetical protein
MLRKLIVGFALAGLGLVAGGGVAAADPTNYPANEAPSVSVSDADVAPGETVTFSGEGFTPGEAIRLEVLGATGEVLDSFLTEADEDGRFSEGVKLTGVGVYTLRATGLESGNVASLTVTVAGVTDSNGGSNNNGSNNSGGSWSSNDNGGTSNEGDLAYTGTSLATPLAIGAGALVAGLLLLFFGTRMTIRRKSHSA